jgi:hypothetical protein
MNSTTVRNSPLSRPLLQPTSNEGGRESEYGVDEGRRRQTPEEEEEVDEEEISAILLEDNNRLLLQCLFGRAYAIQWNFWWQHLPSAAFLGASIGVAVPLFLWTSHNVRGILFTLGRDVHDDDKGSHKAWYLNDTGADSNDDHKHWWWLMWTIGGSLLSSVVLQFPMAPKPETLRTVLNHVAYLEGNVVESLYTVVSTWIALTCGAPIGEAELTHCDPFASSFIHFLFSSFLTFAFPCRC